MERCGSSIRAKEYMPHLLMIASTLAVSGFLVLVKSVVSEGMSGPVFVFYQNLLSTFFLFFLAFLCERNTRPSFSFHILCWAFFLAFLQIVVAQISQTSSLRFVSVTFQSTATNTGTAVTFLLAVAFQQESFRFFSINGQAKLWGITLSTAGAVLIVLWHGPQLQLPAQSLENGNLVIGYLMVASSILAVASCNLLLERITMRYGAIMSLSTLICFFGTIQVGVLAYLTEKSAKAWKIGFNNSSELLAVLYGGILVAGLVSYAHVWCIYKKGPVFVTAFSPLLIVFCFILEALLLKEVTCLGSIVGAVFVVLGLYVLLWAKADDHHEKVKLLVEESTSSPLISSSNSVTETLA